MRVTRSQIVHGVTDYIQNEILPKMGNGRGLQILLSVATNTAAENNKVTEALFAHPMVKAALDDDGSGTYEISGLADAMSKAIQQYGCFPVQIPAIPIVSPQGITMHLSADDVAALKSRIENAV